MNLRKSIMGIALLAVTLSTAAVAGGSGPQSWFVEVPVEDVQPLVERVRVEEPERVCWDEEVERRVRRDGVGPSTSTVVGTIVGGAIGHNIASGRDRDAARIARAVIGAALGRDAAARNARSRRVVTTERRCETQYVSYEEERISGYRVTYRYEGRRFVTRTERDPGDTIRLRVQVRPIHYNDGH